MVKRVGSDVLGRVASVFALGALVVCMALGRPGYARAAPTPLGGANAASPAHAHASIHAVRPHAPHSAAGAPANSSVPASASSATAGTPEHTAEQRLNPDWQVGPQQVDLGHELTLDMPVGHAFLPRGPAAKVLEKNGGFHNEDLLGLVASSGKNSDWFVVIRFEDEGYIKDDEKVDGDEILKSMREGEAAMNEERQKRGFKPLTAEGWTEAPHYVANQHHLIWGLIVSDPDGKSVNYNTRILGRRGFVSLNLVTDPPLLAKYKPEVTQLLQGTHFKPGARYQDFDKKNDKVAEYGLAGLVLAGAGLGAAKLIKIGLLAKFSKVILAALIAGKKAIAVGLIAFGALLKKLFGGKKAATSSST